MASNTRSARGTAFAIWVVDERIARTAATAPFD
jgi:hypothetical protein